MGSDAIWRVCEWAPNQRLPDGYEVGSEWGDIGNGEVGVGCYYFVHEATWTIGLARRTRWEARRDAIAHSKGDDSGVYEIGRG